MGLMERIKEIESEMARTQKNKATNYHLGTLKAKLAKLRSELFLEQSGGGGGGGTGEGFDVARNGDARVALIGFPSVGKSSLLGALTATESEAAAYEFTTLTCIPGVLQYKGSKIQVLDLPGIIEGAAHGAGRGKEVIAVARSADAILIVLDAGKEQGNRHREILERELETVGIRLNQRPPDVTVTKRKSGGGIRFASTVPQPQLGPEPEKIVTNILREYKITTADVLAREEISVDQLVDVVLGNRMYKPCLYLYNKIDTITIEEVDQLARLSHSVVGSVRSQFNIGEPLEDDLLKARLWEYLGLTRIYTKRKGSPPDLEEPVVLSEIRKGTTVKSLCANVSSELLREFNYALVWGTSAKHSPQRCGLSHTLDDEDVVQIVSKTIKQQQQDKNYNVISQQFNDKHAKKRLEAKKQKQQRLRG
ncbi:Developmentally-regulated GTP-binding protein [Seminavis robusta]|uniref:Developmentally-regulated GTP-binding protein n=1 Tax=Seminavis robusta TaxID=568900 RepID=A0A9N8H6J8_9STRA|nr:Developmentally-regulated GTP-binding protein [Seminavis robusta]|eukprot:Sro45_g027140.1 Developmentally-regulated GTP-binding protein (422) ;mRNA; f:123453-125375